MRTLLELVLVVAFAWFVAVTHASGEEPTRVPADVIESWSYLVGSWNVEGRVGTMPVNGKAHFDFAERKYCYFGSQQWNVDTTGRTIHLAIIGGWDAARNELTEHGFSSSGSSATVRYPLPLKDENVLIGKIAGANYPDAHWSGEVKQVRVGRDEFELTTTVDGEIVHSLRYLRNKTPTEPH